MNAWKDLLILPGFSKQNAVAARFDLLYSGALSMKRFASLLLVLAVSVSAVAAQSTIFMVRHAEKGEATSTNPAANDPDLSDAGRARAESLAKMLKNAGITAIYATEFKRTQQTAEPLVKILGIKLTIVPAKDTVTLSAKLRKLHGNALVVGHGNTIPDMIKALGVETPVNIAEADYDNLFVVVVDEKPRLLQLHYR
jgi:broad specificity phosphatase PhoE